MNKQKYHYFYKITNNINNKFYYGIHSTNNLNDGYMGSGKRLHYAYKKYDIENFTKEILKFFNSRKEASDYEAEVVTETLVKKDDCYNVALGSEIPNTLNCIVVYDNQEKCLKKILRDIVKLNKDRYISYYKDKMQVYDKVEQKWVNIMVEEYYSNLDRYSTYFQKDTVMVKDKNGKCFRVKNNDERYLNGELLPIGVGYKHSKETIQKQKNVLKKNHHQQGEKNSQYGTCWVYNEEGNIKIKREELEEYLNKGYKKGRKNVHSNTKISILDINKFKDLLKEGFSIKEIQKIMNVGKTTLYRFRKENNLLS